MRSRFKLLRSLGMVLGAFGTVGCLAHCVYFGVADYPPITPLHVSLFTIEYGAMITGLVMLVVSLYSGVPKDQR